MTFSKELKSNLQSEYSTNIIDGFYQPVLREAKLYQRVSAYFSSDGLDLYIDGLEELAKNGGKVQFIISKEISKHDFDRIKAGYELQKELENLRISERNGRLTSETQKKLGNLAFMIAMGHADVKIALTKNGIFHDKFGIISREDETIFFNGSVNETRGGMQTNYESISVDVSWDMSEYVQKRIKKSIDRFNRLWTNTEPGVLVVDVSETTYKKIAQYETQSDISHEFLQTGYEDDKKNTEENTISFVLRNNRIIRVDSSDVQLTVNDRKLKKGGDLSIYFEDDNSMMVENISYKDVERIIDITTVRAERKNLNVCVSESVNNYIKRNKYSIEHYKILGDVFKGNPNKFPADKKIGFNEFSKIVQKEVIRPLYPIHLQAAYFEYEMARVANFSVPGAGKTAMILGVFAYLNRENASANEKVERILVVCPLNAFDSWKHEFHAVFGNKKELRVIDTQITKDFNEALNIDWGFSNLIIVNYESLPRYTNKLKSLIDERTMLVFDEVHRIKNPAGKRALNALDISKLPKFKYVLTGTPIPNTYQDIYNFLNLLYPNEYNSFFGWEVNELINPKIKKVREINRKLHPFFWRTNKQDLDVPAAEPDIIEVVKPSTQQLKLAEMIYYKEKSSLAKLIRLIQASTNPSLINEKINYNELMSFDDDGDIKGISKEEFYELLEENDVEKSLESLHRNKNYDIDEIVNSPKFERGIELVEKLVSENKKVLVWGIFVNTLLKIERTLIRKGINVNLVYGGTDKNERADMINEFRYGSVQVLVSNPQTLGESISLHDSVHDAVYFEYDFNLTFMLQSRDRIHRLGLKENQYTRYYYLQTASEDAISSRPGFIDEKIYSRLKDKEDLMYKAIDGTLPVEYSDDEIREAIKIIDEERIRIESEK
ncbi:SNF2-related protein [Erysipelothrix rhusiopathiae]|nr:SNF2-related protein [Erysipelothrix rhusiopathiae]MDE8039576.1 SNF2-related protein [Erysipelothrix rhusiopathiae]MDE8042306.1 SNF2-related protein [Erysipelothrix rhusiopathiae]MDE8049761.1 SNF2-related protein [Erysipelothrix rhusiopathiae]MDE8051371.1 SNF2-related protein [Erysipelothrix rhusiopathiae]